MSWWNPTTWFASNAPNLERTYNVALAEAVNKIRRSYDGGRLDRRTKPWQAVQQSGETYDQGEVQRIRWRAWDLYRNNPYARRAVNAIVSQVLGCGLDPSPTAVNQSDEPDEAFRESSRRLWDRWCRQADYRGVPGYGGHNFEHLAQSVLTEVIISGEVLVRFRFMPQKLVRRERRTIPFAIELISAERLIEDYSNSRNAGSPSTQPVPENHYIYRGIEYDADDRRVAYHVYDHHPNDPRPHVWWYRSRRIPANEVLHIFRQDRPDQIRGVSWMAPVLMQLRDIVDYQENELVSASIAACVSMFIQKQPGSPAAGLNTPSGGDSTDDDGNPVTRMQPGLITELGPGETIQGFNPARPSGSAETFINHLLRGVASGLGGLKSSTLTGDYRGSSYTSEKANDNDVWRVIEQLQEWLASCFHQPVYERLLDEAMSEGWFDTLDGRAFSRARYAAQRDRFVGAKWNGPVEKSVNPGVDIKASQLAIATGIASHETEAAAHGFTTDELIEQEVRYLEKLESTGLQAIRTKQAQDMQPQKEGPPGGGKPKGKESNGGKEGNIGQNQKAN